MREQPKLVVLIADGHCFESRGAHGNAEVRTPSLDALATRRLACDAAHCEGGMHGAICVPSRARLMAGRDIFAATMDPTGRDYRASLTMPEDMITFRNGSVASGTTPTPSARGTTTPACSTAPSRAPSG